MKIIRNLQEMQQTSQKLKLEGKTIGFVPTMGYLHEGHMSLVKNARNENDIVVVSIFVNPLQFGPNEDFESYPRDFERDEKMAKENGVDIIFYPSSEEMYPNELTVQAVALRRTDVLCGKSRVGHFDGVVTVLTKLFHLVMPNKAYFGMKDAQQVAIVEGLIQDFNFPIELVRVETVREHDGLAKSSRNVYLTEKERKEAPQLYKALQLGKKLIEEGERNPNTVVDAVRRHIEQHTSGTIDYVEIYSYPQLTPLTELNGHVILAIAVKFSKARLIDNMTFTV